MKPLGATASVEIAKELHDGVCQTLTGMHLQFSILSAKIKRECPGYAVELKEFEKNLRRARKELTAILKRYPH